MVNVGKREFLTPGSIGNGNVSCWYRPGCRTRWRFWCEIPQQSYAVQRINKAIELLEQDQPIYYTGADPRLPRI